MTRLTVTYVSAVALFLMLPVAYWVDRFACGIDGAQSRLRFAAETVYCTAAMSSIIVVLRVTAQVIHFQF